ncbi:MAG: UDP-glucose 4-epimerase GalE [Bradyrhizobium sp.]|uniref:UDP-glucose 4-epimerase GalE n=1 Tax=Bradyrhizobium sp. TaxID=376 RepID=UPI00120E28B6|nr:UDP-glucose 4-epimerase GalE [Bradyrhizobium sp.]THD70061.1 MAG: UDP-glucose 4-epimerase GalE [Bradyrhizobium sp.]
MTIMVTGGAGYIGSHVCVELMRAGHSIVIFDNFCNSHREAVNRIGVIAGVSPTVIDGDVRDRGLLASTLANYRCSAVIHLAGLKSIAESVSDPIRYYDNNVYGTLGLVQAMRDTGVHKLVFSSSATVYGAPVYLPLREDHPLAPCNPYGRTKLMIEQMLGDLAASDGSLKIAILRYFNPAGAHESGLIGEDPRGTPNNVMPFLAQVAIGRRPHLTIFGKDYDTPDGTGVRDYLHVTDLAVGHLRALDALERQDRIKVNLGTGRGTSVLDLVEAFSAACGKHIPVVFAPRREGDVASSYASCDLAQQILGWRATRDLKAMCRDAWKWQSSNPQGYGDPRSSS